MGKKAVDLLTEGKYNLVVCYNNGKICDVEMEYAFLLDRIVKGKATEEEIASLAPDLREKMLLDAENIKENMNSLYEIANIMAR